MTEQHKQVALKLLDEHKEHILRNEVLERLYQKQLLTSVNKNLAEQNLKAKQLEIAAGKKLVEELEILIKELWP